MGTGWAAAGMSIRLSAETIGDRHLPRNVGVEAGMDPGPAPMMTCERHEPDERLDGTLPRSERTDRTLFLCARTNLCRSLRVAPAATL